MNASLHLNGSPEFFEIALRILHERNTKILVETIGEFHLAGGEVELLVFLRCDIGVLILGEGRDIAVKCEKPKKISGVELFEIYHSGDNRGTLQ